ncbi:hypothetical protein PV02_04795 [Methanolobus chelungpuianus]|uniref:Uncharacterized protein n=2 Tax=Methanolobus chelungpuianus TaxID=502115 RepID=A0AAE3HA04_9EURY|nr:hypothetical protein [Methanolobus chelungpuianus]
MASLLLVTCTATFAGASMFELEIVPVSKLIEQPSVYDSTLAYRKISVVGNLSELNKHSASIADDRSALKVDVTRIQLFEGFELGEQVMLTGEFRHNSLGDDIMHPSYVLHYPVQNAGQASISDINGNQALYNGRYVTITGNLSSIELSAGSYKAMVTEEDTGEQTKVFYYGATDLKGGEEVKVYGLYNSGILHSENMAKNRSPLSLTALVPGFSVVMSLAALGGVAILLSQRQR